MTTRPDKSSERTAPSGDELFGAAATEYARFRPGVPDAAVRLLAATLHGVPAPVLLDLGTGTAQVPRALLPVVPRLAHIHLVDINPGMLARAMADLKPVLGTCTVSAHTGQAHTFVPQTPERRPDLITCCRAFHWVERPAVLRMADRLATPRAAVAIMGDGSLWTHDADWTKALRELIQSYLGQDRRAGVRGTYAEPGRSYEDDLADSAFSDVSDHRFPVSRAWTPESVVGYLRSTSFAQPGLFADRHEEFEAEARQLLETYAHEGVLREEAVFTVLMARRPGAAS
ncbi:methyltransferase domain-containing protein [Streptomyces sp. LX-29]|uniref:class I SAM-dependent methyltransferase n=1 Tax=Streptomyces sp. LX-29 TaxID=2900152 RepID=UPI00240E2A80|nr:methyltransferase domain-containing protein [Streptomyces sp. LX-29]WFB11360.1 methyltransferase domain-containing protein [Streptomyces sp. LX-29]